MGDSDYTTNYIIHPDGRIQNARTKKFLKPCRMDSGYLQITLYDFKGHNKRFLVHRLVAISHVPNPNNKPQVNHKNMVRDDNRAENLEWVTCAENLRHARANGRKIYTPERNAKISRAKRGVPRPPEVIAKIKATKRRLGIGKGESNPMYGRHLTSEQIQKRTHSRYHKNKTDPKCPFCQV